ncbi:hypothetical protein B0H11DRAFT_2156691 [Mycena galericulata]|nr:hypothetical protein B0H11DRAFT_2156691 [Mycena galericulata]
MVDNPGWTATRRAQRARADGNFLPVESVAPMDEHFIGGFSPLLRPPTPGAPPLPPKDEIYRQPGYRFGQTTKSSITSSHLTTLSAVERSQALRIPRMDPHLQVRFGLLCATDVYQSTGFQFVWVLSVSSAAADSGSVYEPHPILSYEWDPDKSGNMGKTHNLNGKSFDLGPHPADPHPGSTLNGLPTVGNGKAARGPNARSEQVPAHEIWLLTSTFWRFPIEIPLGPMEMAVSYSINNGQPLVFHVPGKDQNMRWAAYSCNGFSAGVNPDDFRGPGFNTGYDPVWMDLLSKHEPFHVLVGGGDQIYCDGYAGRPYVAKWIRSKPAERKQYPLTEEITSAIDRFYFNHYCSQWRSGAFARANSSMYDDQRHIDGFGSYPEDLQVAPVFRTIGSRGYFFFLLFQCFINVDIDGVDDRPGKHLNRSAIIGVSNGPYIPFPSHSFLGYMGPQTYILLLDCRAERKRDQVCSQAEYQKVFERLSKLPSSVEHLCVQIGIPIAYPRLVFLEAALESPLAALGRAFSPSFTNKFNSDAELLDDLNDHWTSRSHKKERNWFIEQLQKFSKIHRIRISFLSGDVHCAAVGVFKTLAVKKTEIPPPDDHRYMINVVTSQFFFGPSRRLNVYVYSGAIVNTPPPNAVISMVSRLASNNHKTMHHLHTDETMVPLFTTKTNGKPRKQKFIMGRRNWCQVKWENGDWVFEIRVEKEKGVGQTVGYSIRSPPPRWTLNS